MADKDPTEYVVLVQTDDKGVTWERLGRVKAAGQAAAKRQALAQYRPEGGMVVAVPVRSWEPEDLKPQLRFA